LEQYFIYQKLLLWYLVRELKQIGKYLARKVINSKFKSKNTIFIELTKDLKNNTYYLNHYSLESYLILL
jgi:hypothetical protein